MVEVYLRRRIDNYLTLWKKVLFGIFRVWIQPMQIKK